MIPTMRPPSLYGNDPETKREEIRRYFHAAFDTFESLFTLLRNDDVFYHRPEPLRHPHIFYFGHTAVFFVNKLLLAKMIDERIDPKLESVFAVGVDEMSWDDLNEAHYDWPSVDATRAYRDKVRELVDRLISSLPLELPITWESPWWVILMGIEHERIHIETSSVLIRQTDISLVQPRSDWPRCRISGDAPDNTLLPVPGKKVVIGKAKNDDFYGWDNEYGHHEADIPDFKASKYLVTNAEYMPFVEAGGYENDEWWEEEGLAWRNFKKAKHPLFWIPAEKGYRYRALAEIIEMPMDWPVDVNYHEAKAFCNWLGEKRGKKLRLPTEDEWYRLYARCNVPDVPEWGEKAPANINLEHYASACPVTEFRHGDFFDAVGNVWQWTETPIYPFEGFEVHPVYDDFTTPTFDTRHNLIKGGSFVSTGNETLKSARYAFRRHFYQHAGFRYVESDYQERVGSASYESDTQVSQYCEFGWGREYFGISNYPETCAKICIETSVGKPRKRALDIGCAIGRSTFELATAFEKVTGLDFSARFIGMAEKMRNAGRIRYQIPTEGELVEYMEAVLPERLANVADRVDFWQADACNLKPIFTGYDLVFAGNLIDRLYDPAKFLRDITERINGGGILVLTSPYTWLEAYTPKAKWLGGFKRDGEPVTTLEGLEAHLEPAFRLVETRDVEFVIRETARKFQHSVAQMSIWEKQ
ncbi:5-histidylcysteine sulfoxide synthase [Hydrogenimonas cancrithermarum]|uniref:SAM-dependent methyltransferase n=1 Tax=Hydrogenimonas cancrithermarum TaxID=2993563 RepID=A0ABM8FLC8_9BACT|nr:5-histidylcysteine sulfoxide synthase [Hydrogenimonas cancrithermarum]BDY12508.1 SAM-dependent methyltransferase [Hydrogenimonas cancrithermarum]